MKISVRYFAMLRERKGCESEQVEVPEGTTAGAAYERLFEAGPSGRVPVAYAVNGAYAQATTLLSEGDEVAFLPPVGGGL